MSRLKDVVFVKSPRGISALRGERKIMRKKRRVSDDMDQAFPNGIFNDPIENAPNIRFRDMDNYCKIIGKKPTELTKEEINNFRNK